MEASSTDSLGQALELMRVGNVSAAAGALAAVLAGDVPVATEQLFACGCALIALGDNAHAIMALERALRQTAADGDADGMARIASWLGAAQAEAGQLESAASLAELTRREGAAQSAGLVLLRARLAGAGDGAASAAAICGDALTAGRFGAADQVPILLEQSRWLRRSGDVTSAALAVDRAEKLAGLLGDRILLAWCRRERAVGHGEASVQRAAAAISSNRLYIRMLGTFDIVRDGTPLATAAWPRRKAASLLQYLAVQPHWQAPRERVIALLWGEEADANPLHVTVHALRRALTDGLSERPAYVIVTNGLIGLAPALIAGCDVTEFRACVQAARAFREIDPQQSLASYRQAKAIYGGELLAGASEPWVEPLRETLERMYVETLTCLAKAGTDDPLGLWLEVIAREPANEEALFETMHRLATAGRKTQAIKCYQRYASYVEHELGLHVAPRLESLYHQLNAKVGDGGD